MTSYYKFVKNLIYSFIYYNHILNKNMYASFYIILFQTSTNKSHKNKQALKIDRTIRPQRPHDPASTTA